MARYLIGEGVAHDERRVPHGAAQVDQSALGQDNDVTTVFQKVAVNLSRGRLQLRRRSQPLGQNPPFWLPYLRLDVDPFCVFVEPAYVDFAVKVSDVADNGVVLHLLKVTEDKTGGINQDAALRRPASTLKRTVPG